MLGGVVYTIAFAIYAWTASPGLGWLDSPEFAAAATGLGVAHSPGHPLPALLGKLASLVPIGDLALRVNLASAAAGAAAAAILACAARDVINGDRGARRLGPTVAAGAIAMLFALSWASWAQAVRAEVYSLQAALCAGMLWAAIRHRRTGSLRALAVAGLCAGLALANHHLIAGLAILPIAVLAFARSSPSRARVLAIASVTGLLGLASFLYLPVRSARGPEVNWGAPHTADRFAWTVSARAFQKATTTERVSTRGEDAAQIAVAVAEAASAPLIVLAAAGLLLALRRRGCRGEAAMLAAVIALAIAGRAVVGFDPETADHHGYLLPAIVAIALLAALALRNMLELGGAAATTAVGLVLALTLPAQLALGARASLGDSRGGDELARWELEALPPRAAVLTAYFETSFRLEALRVLEQSRPDIAIVDRSFLTYPGTAAELSRRYPDLEPLIDAPLRADQPTPLDKVAAVARRRPVLFQLHFNLDPPVRPHLVPIGPFAAFSPAPVGPEQRAGGERYDARARAELGTRLAAAGHGDTGDARRALLWHDAMRMLFYCESGRREAARDAFASAWALVPGDVTLAEQARACGLEVPDRVRPDPRGDSI